MKFRLQHSVLFKDDQIGIGGGSGGLGGFSPPTLFYHGQLIRTILESSSKRRVVCPKQETNDVLRSRLVRTFHFLFPLPPPTPYRRLSYVVFVVGITEDCIRGVQNVVSLIARWREGGRKMEYPTLISEKWRKHGKESWRSQDWGISLFAESCTTHGTFYCRSCQYGRT